MKSKLDNYKYELKDGSATLHFRYPTVKEHRAIAAMFQCDDEETHLQEYSKGINGILVGWESDTPYTGDIQDLATVADLYFLKSELLHNLMLDDITKKKSLSVLVTTTQNQMAKE